MTGTDGHVLPEETSQTLDMYNIDKIDHTISLTQAQRNYFVSGNTSPENLNILNLAIEERNRTRTRLEGQAYPAGRDQLIRLGPREFALPNGGYNRENTTNTPTTPPAGSAGVSANTENIASSSNMSAPSSQPVPTPSNAHTVTSLVQMFQNLSPTSIKSVISALSNQSSFIPPPTAASTISPNTFERNLEQPASVNYTECYNQVPPPHDLLLSKSHMLVSCYQPQLARHVTHPTVW